MREDYHLRMKAEYQIIVIGGGHAGAEAAWAAANLLREPSSVALVTANPARIGAMSCNPAIGGLAKGQLVREIDALGGLMGLAADASGIMFKMLNTSRGPAVHGPRCQCDKNEYALAVQRMIASRAEIDVIPGLVDDFILDEVGVAVGVKISPPSDVKPLSVTSVCDAATQIEQRAAAQKIDRDEIPSELRAGATVLTTGTFMRGLMHTGEHRTPGGQVRRSTRDRDLQDTQRTRLRARSPQDRHTSKDRQTLDRLGEPAHTARRREPQAVLRAIGASGYV